MADEQDDNLEDKDKRVTNRMDFIVEQQARIDASLELVGERLNQLAARDGVLSGRQDNLTADVASLVHGVEVFKEDVRGAIQNLIVANEVTRDLAEQVARLAIQTSQRVADLDGQ